jgi:hypothetical protein
VQPKASERLENGENRLAQPISAMPAQAFQHGADLAHLFASCYESVPPLTSNCSIMNQARFTFADLGQPVGNQ